ncbi:MAG: hypothetical protein IPJ49_14780 [Candidatus Obscuribacter sp.]|nr:hypothetical protein [Candidatus Obscuribacter sp.]
MSYRGIFLAKHQGKVPGTSLIDRREVAWYCFYRAQSHGVVFLALLGNCVLFGEHKHGLEFDSAKSGDTREHCHQKRVCLRRIEQDIGIARGQGDVCEHAKKARVGAFHHDKASDS